MEEDQVVEQQDDLEKMIAHMRSEALKRGKDWLRAKMVDREDEAQVHGAPAPTKQTEEMSETERSPSPSQKSTKRQKSEGKPARKSAKRPKVTLQSTEETAVPNPGASLAPAEGGGRGGERSLRQASIQAAVREQQSTGDPAAAWGVLTKVAEATRNIGSAPESYARPSLGAPSMTTRAAGLATAIPLTVKERIWRKEFIDIFTLLEIQLEGLDLTICDKKEDDRRERKRARKERNFENWLDAFRIMACVIVEKFPRSAADLWLYESKIHEAHRQFSGDAWLEYDKSFRLKMQAHPEMEWNQEDVSSYIHKMMVAREASAWAGKGEQSFRTGHNKGRHDKFKATHRHKTWHSNRTKGDNGSQAICWKFEADECSWGQNCKFRHSCSTCGGEHPASTCRKLKHKSDRKDKKKK
ncbi:hypothetical protein NDU88_003058 [Pleurodeles waltl]|uniref:C3H1-type domain-containing protein n=1 Tax=Pleurodeles waltl TaxID=8319 RepID=A0AAV7Q8M4_PLEWA|nr:hypothetical protein NDU88_003058 [Pleurodeles waltl]